MTNQPDRGSAAAPSVVRSSPELEVEPGSPRARSRWVLEPGGDAWDGFALSEWELTAAGWSDQHPHSETNLVVEGELYVESGGVTVVAQVGDTVTVPAGEVGRYWAPDHARMLAIYGPNPRGEPSTDVGYWEL
jgi:quercetin dioxygenase-like cupin family protein